MDKFRNTFIVNKLKCVEENLDTLADQLMWIQEFIQTEYGGKFSKFIEGRTTQKYETSLNAQANKNYHKIIQNKSLRKNKRSKPNSKKDGQNNASDTSSSEGEYHPENDEKNLCSDEKEDSADSNNDNFAIHDALEEDNEDCSTPNEDEEGLGSNNCNSKTKIRSHLETNISTQSGLLKSVSTHGIHNDNDANQSYETIDASLIFQNMDHNQMEVEVAVNQTTENPIKDYGNQSQDPNKTEVVIKKRRNKVRKPEEWGRQVAYNNRLKGEAYTAKKRVNGKLVTYSMPAKKMGKKCQSKGCKRVKSIHCDQFSDGYRKKLFDRFWKQMNWDEKKAYVNSLVDVIPRTFKTSKGTKSRRTTFFYHLFDENGSGRKVRVCKEMFRSTFDIGRRSLLGWTQKYNSNSIKVENENTLSSSECSD